MPVPFIYIAIAAVSALLGPVILNWDRFVIKYKGKKIAVLGARGVGKSHLINFLSSGSIPSEYRQTVAPLQVGQRRFQLKDLDLKLKDTLDVSGAKDAYAEWKQLHDEADLVFYLLRADRLIAGDLEVESRVRDDLRHIGSWLQARSPRPQFFIVGTHCDFDREFVTLDTNRMGDYVDKFRKLQIVNDLVAHGGGGQSVKVVLGSMNSIQDTEALVYQIFMQVAP